MSSAYRPGFGPASRRVVVALTLASQLVGCSSMNPSRQHPRPASPVIQTSANLEPTSPKPATAKADPHWSWKTSKTRTYLRRTTHAAEVRTKDAARFAGLAAFWTTAAAAIGGLLYLDLTHGDLLNNDE